MQCRIVVTKCADVIIQARISSVDLSSGEPTQTRFFVRPSSAQIVAHVSSSRSCEMEIAFICLNAKVSIGSGVGDD